MHQAGRVQHLQSCRSMQHLVGDNTALAGTEDDQRGAHHLAQLAGEMAEGGSEELVVGMQG